MTAGSTPSSARRIPTIPATPFSTVERSADDLRTTLEVTGSDGEWTMEVYDSAAQDTGRLNSWSLLVR